MPPDSVTTVAEAVTEVAKTTSKGLDALTEFSHFISKFTLAPLEAGAAIVTDKLKFRRAENLIRFHARIKKVMEEARIENLTRPVLLQFAIPLLEQASLEENDALQDLWARLLVNAVAVNGPVEMRRAYISILEQLTSLDALILLKIYSSLEGPSDKIGVVTGGLPRNVSFARFGESGENWPQPTSEVKLSLANLARVGCVDLGDTFGGQKYYSVISQTILGQAFVEAVTL